MSAKDDFYTHIRNRYRMAAPVSEKIRWHQTKISLLRKYAKEDPAMKAWADGEIDGCELMIDSLVSGDIG